MTGDELQSQIWIGDEPTPDEINPIVLRKVVRGKPRGGIWTSTEDADGESAWIKWCKRNKWWNSSERNVWRLTLKEDLEVLHIDRITDISPWLQNDWVPNYPDWEAVFQEFDGVHLTREGVANTRFTAPGRCDLYGWDAECTVWDGWHFQSKELIGEVVTEDNEFVRLVPK